MPWTTPSTVSTGDTLSAATWNQDVVANTLMGQPVFVNEAARDAAIPSPSEGQACYLTASTVAAPTGGTTYVPTGVTTIYNGSAWVCVTPVSAYTSNAGTTTSTSYTTTLSGTPGTNVSVTVTTGTTALISLYGEGFNSGTNAGYIGIGVSGATTIAAADGNAAVFVAASTDVYSFCKTWIVGGLTAGDNTFTIHYRVAAGTGTFRERRLTVQGVA